MSVSECVCYRSTFNFPLTHTQSHSANTLANGAKSGLGGVELEGTWNLMLSCSLPKQRVLEISMRGHIKYKYKKQYIYTYMRNM